MKMSRLPRSITRYLILIKQAITRQVIQRTRFLIGTVLKTSLRVTDALIPVMSLIAIGIVIYDVGFRPFYSFGPLTYRLLVICLLLLRALMVVRFIAELQEKRRIWVHVFSFLLILLTFYLYNILQLIGQTEPLRTNSFLVNKLILYGGIILIFSTEASDLL
ncbi:MAG TPA: hypothetical protein VIH22_11160, partial [Cyclobacteriaceae bacterium]